MVEAFGEWLKEQRARVSPKSRLGEKLGYIARHWDGLRLLLADGRVTMDSNAVENSRPPDCPYKKKCTLRRPRRRRRRLGTYRLAHPDGEIERGEPCVWLKATVSCLVGARRAASMASPAASAASAIALAFSDVYRRATLFSAFTGSMI